MNPHALLTTPAARRVARASAAARLGLALMLALALLVSACSADTTHWTPAASPKANRVELVPLTHDVAFPAARAEMDAAARDRLRDFLARHEVGYGDRLYVIAATGAPSPLAVRRAEALALDLARQGLAPKVLPSAEWAGAPEGDGAVRVLVHRFVVAPPNCPDWRKPAHADYGNTEASNFGCATATNLGLMVADPRDLIEGRDEGLADGERAAAAIKRYREGKETPLDSTGASE